MFESAGIQPGEKISGELIELLEKEEDFDLTEYQYPKPAMKMHWYDFIVPIGIKLNFADYPFQKIIPLFEEIDEKQLNREKAKRMLDELKAYVNNDLKSNYSVNHS